MARAAKIAPLLLLVALGACMPTWPRTDWNGYVSETESLQFVAGASCGTDPPFSPVKTEFFEISSASAVPGELWTFVFTYNTLMEREIVRLEVVQWWTARKTHLAPRKPYSEHRRCAVRVDLPKSKEEIRPYYLEDERTKISEYQSLLAWQWRIFWLLAAVVMVILIPSLFGFDVDVLDDDSMTSLTLAVASGVVVLAGSFLVAYVNLSVPWQEFEKARSYFRFFDELPRRDGKLLPLTQSEFYFLLAGPPHPKGMQFDFSLYFWVSIGLAVAWVSVMAVFFVRGLYALFVPLPLAVAHRRATAEGRQLSADEAAAAMQQAVVGRRPWQLRIMQRKAEAFARRFGYVMSNQ